MYFCLLYLQMLAPLEVLEPHLENYCCKIVVSKHFLLGPPLVNKKKKKLRHYGAAPPALGISVLIHYGVIKYLLKCI